LSDRDTARHRAPQRAATPLSQLTGAVTDQLGDAAGRTGAILAISTGLMAAVSVPAQALTGGSATSPVTSSGPAAASAAPAYSALTASSTLTAAPGALQTAGAALTAPSTAVVAFESGTFTAVPKPAAPRVRPQASPAESRTAGSRTAADEDTEGSSTATGGIAAKGSSVLAIAARYVGTPYVYGGTTPRGFDCSGFTRYVYAQLGISLPRTANQQMNATRRVSRSEARPGDLVFFVSAGRAYHNGLYAGDGKMYDSPRSGKSLQKREIWDATVVFGRVTG
jgi:cell wall-associated NlpC family hydrolase